MNEPLLEAVQSTRGFNVIFIHSSLDDAGLDPYEFRLFGHISRRAGEGTCWASMSAMAKVCGMCEDVLRRALKTLIDRQMIKREERPGRTTRLIILPPTMWILHPPGQNGGVNNPPVPSLPHPPGVNPPEGNPGKVIPKNGAKVKKTELPPIPEKLNTSPFIKAWNDWLENRKNQRKPVTPAAATRQFNFLLTLGPINAIRSIDQSIMNGWTGLFNVDNRNGNGNGHASKEKAFRVGDGCL